MFNVSGTDGDVNVDCDHGRRHIDTDNVKAHLGSGDGGEQMPTVTENHTTHYG